MRPAGPERVCSPEQAAALVAAEVTGIGNGFARYPALQEAAVSLAAVHDDIWPAADIMPSLALDWLRENEPLPAAAAQPVYLRDNVAQKTTSA
jgi:tRNA A37 threonylcarbamoyladenosine modification protein TsaB